MSLFSNKSTVYDFLVTATDTVNDAIISIKKYNVLQFGRMQEIPNLKMSDYEYADAKLIIISLLSQLLDDVDVPGNSDKIFAPEVMQILQINIDGIAYFSDRAKELMGRLVQDHELQLVDYELLDEIVSMLDVRRTILFKELIGRVV